MRRVWVGAGGGLNHAAAEALPIEIGPSAEVGVVIAHRTIHFGQQLDGSNALAGLAQTHHDVGDLFAYSGGAGGLSVGAAEHGYSGMAMGQPAQALDQTVEGGQ